MKKEAVQLKSGQWLIVNAEEYLGGVLSENKIYERPETAFWTRSLKPGMNALDLGAHVGYYTVQAASLVGPTGRVFAFEPDPVNCSLLRESVAANEFTNVTVIEKAVANYDGPGTLFLSQGNHGDHRLSPEPTQPERRTVAVDVVKLDSFLPSLKVDAIKMDLQGAEYATWKGMTNILERSPNAVILMEFWPAVLEDSADFLDLMLASDYHFYRPNGRGDMIPIDREYLQVLYGTRKFYNIIVSKRKP